MAGTPFTILGQRGGIQSLILDAQRIEGGRPAVAGEVSQPTRERRLVEREVGEGLAPSGDGDSQIVIRQCWLCH